MAIMMHEGYLAALEKDKDARVIRGRVINVINAPAMLTFEGKTCAELRQAFVYTIADYREWCAERRVEPEKPDKARDEAIVNISKLAKIRASKLPGFYAIITQFKNVSADIDNPKREPRKLASPS